MAAIQYNGHVTMTYLDYIDTATGKTLVCAPGQSYNIAPASGNIRSAGTTMPQDGRFTTGSGMNIKFADEEEEKALVLPEEDKTTPPGGKD